MTTQKLKWSEAVNKVIAVRDDLLPWEPISPGHRIQARSLPDKSAECLLAMKPRQGGRQSLWVLYAEHEGYYLTGGCEDSPEKALAAADRVLMEIDPEKPLPVSSKMSGLLFWGDMIDEVEQPDMGAA